MGNRELPRLQDGELVKGRWRVEATLGHGGFGAVYLVRDEQHQGPGPNRFAMKTEDVNARTTILKMEIAVLRRLNDAGALHACRLQGRGKTQQMNFVVMTLVSASLNHIIRGRPGRCLSKSTGLRVATQAVEALQELHSVGFLHRDVKPANFAVGRREAKQQRLVFILDFGLSREYRTAEGILRTPRESTGFRGTVRYAPLASHNKEELSPKDDLESWLYQTLETMYGALPWAAVAEKALVGRAKQVSRQNGTLLARAPAEFHLILQHIDSLHYVDSPEYAFITSTIAAAATRLGVDLDKPFDWESMSNVA